jgi:hypothetical protein
MDTTDPVGGNVAHGLRRVSYHAVTRYVQRFVGVTLEHVSGQGERDRALAHCNAAGLSIDAVRELLSPPMVRFAMQMGVPEFSLRGVHYHVENGVIITVTRDEPKNPTRLRVLSERELRRKMRRKDRCTKRAPKVALAIGEWE